MRVALNTAQKQAVEHDLGPMLVLAGAGSGKTGVVTQRIARLIKGGVGPQSILAVTFTNKAAGEMLERVVKLVGQKACTGLLVCTFHRFGLEVLTRETKALGLRGGRFAIFDRGDSLGVLREVMRRTAVFASGRGPHPAGGKSYDLAAVMNRISLAKNAFLDPEAYAAAVAGRDDPYDEITTLTYPRYGEALRSLQAYDFDDLICEPVRLWRRREDVLARWRMRFRYLIVDEYQDTNLVQLEMLRLLSHDHQNLCVVGDDDQAIYAWRGADVRNILDFDKQFANTLVVRLERNYRSREPVLAVANAVLAASHARRHPKKLLATRGEGDKARLVVALDADIEARFVADEIHRLCEGGQVRPRDVAVLYRSNLQAGAIEAELRGRGVPYQLFGGTQVFERKEVKDLLAYLSAAIDRHHELAVRRSLSYPPRGVGDAAIEKLASFATAHDLPLLAAVERAHAVELSDAARAGCREYARVVDELKNAIEAGTSTGSAVVRRLVEAIGLRELLFAEAGANVKAAARRWGNVEFLLRAFERRDAHGPMDRERFAEFLRLLLLREDGDDSEAGQDRVTLTTMHGAKGLEFPYVFLVGLEEGLLPHARTLDERATDAQALDDGGFAESADEIEQERRLFYVAITRARERLYLLHANARPSRGKLMKRAPSRFLLDIPPELLERQEILAPAPPDPRQIAKGAQDVLAALLGASGGS